MKNSGVHVDSNRGTEFTLWSPYAKKVDLKLISPKQDLIPMEKHDDGYFSIHLDQKEPLDYLYLIDNQHELPDPLSNCQPFGVFGPSRTVTHDAYLWTDRDWRGIPLKDYIIYELHVGTFTEEGSFEAIIEKLDHLKDLGITAIELMPVSSFSGTRNWGYDGVFPFAPQESYGGPDGLKALINACHNRGFAVVLDVVYNHFGPEGNVFERYGPYLTDRYQTPWGKALNYDGDKSQAVREFVIANALYWLRAYHIDALRLDAVHGIFDNSSTHILQELHEHFAGQAQLLGREAFLFAESDLNSVRIIQKITQGGYGIDSQWNDEFHHALRTYLIPSKKSYFADFGSLADLKKAIDEGFVYDGCYSSFRKKHFGSSSKGLSGEKFVIFSQNHDQIANASMGKREAELLDEKKLKIIACLLIFCPHIPMLFMGQEWGTQDPFYFFTSFENKALAEAVKTGRKKEYEGHHIEEEFKDPQSLETFLMSKLDWKKSESPLFTFYQTLIHLRKSEPALNNCEMPLMQIDMDEDKRQLSITRIAPTGRDALRLYVNFSSKAWTINKDKELIMDTGTPTEALQAYSARIVRCGV